MKLTEFIKSQLCWVIESAESRDQLLRDLTDRIAQAEEGIDGDLVYAALIEREEKGATSTPEGVAFPHAMIKQADRSFVGTALIRHGGVKFSHKAHPASDLVFVLVGPAEAAWDHVRLLARLARICHAPGALQSLRQAADGGDLFRRLCAEDSRHV